MKAYKFVAESNRKSRQRNKKLYDRKAKVRHFSSNDLVYFYNPALKPGLTRKFRRPWTGPYKITRKITEMNYEIVDQNDKKQLVHVNRLKRLYNQDLWEPTQRETLGKRHPNVRRNTQTHAKKMNSGQDHYPCA
jgi:hypothetical protein